ncbi:hypothetical protein HII31_00787 [Pseudocercospora fuligena]|uniref:Uncharacterized protein n=1 Tax=Pseudocercospora fuligena TaxID=685502 RepID=A0A8H6VMD3_9PEZI|nr:hypothetical protein HII31_00787 [Pseudocercospora fuligena]
MKRWGARTCSCLLLNQDTSSKTDLLKHHIMTGQKRPSGDSGDKLPSRKSPRKNAAANFDPASVSASASSTMIAPRDRTVFRFMDLAAELRELIYEFASAPFPPVNTAAINNTPDMVHIPKIAQLNKQTRSEALAVFYRNRELKLSLHCERNIYRAESWLDAAGSGRIMPGLITFSGREPGGTFFHIEVRCSKNDPQFTVISRPGSALPGVDRARHDRLCNKLSAYLSGLKKSGDLVGHLTAGEVKTALSLLEGWIAYAAGQPERQPDTNW